VARLFAFDEPLVAPRPGDVQVWMAAVDAGISATVRQHCEGVLSLRERERMGRFRSASDREHYGVAHGLLRTTLARYLQNVPPAAIVFEVGAHGRPELEPACARGLRFNLSHTRGMVLFAVTHTHPVGVDVESTQRPAPNPLDERDFSAVERATIDSAPDGARDARFYEHWTLKEAYLKARGVGLTVSLRSAAFQLRGAERIEATLDGDDSARWHFQRLPAGDGHCAALAVQLGGTSAARRVFVSDLEGRLRLPVDG